jgi:hypothetical protein
VSDLRQAIKLIGGVEPTPQQMQRVQAIAHSLGIPNNDAMMPILIALDCYHGAFNEMPAKAQAAADAIAKSTVNKTTTELDGAMAKAITNMGPRVGDAIIKVANDINQVDKAKWIGGVMVVVGLLFSFLGWITHASGYSSGFETGKAQAYQDVKDEKAAAAWANTPQGMLAFQLAQAGSVEMLAHCNGTGWELSKGTCYPQPVAEGKTRKIYGWSVGQTATGNRARKISLSWWDHLVGNEG